MTYINLEPPSDKRVAVATEVLCEFTNSEIPLNNDVLKKRMTTSLFQNNCLEFVQFTCQSMNGIKLNSKTPEDYITTSLEGNNFLLNLPRLKKLIAALNRNQIPSIVNIVLADTDAEDFIFPVLNCGQLNDGLTEVRKQTYYENFIQELKSSSWLTAYPFRLSEIRESYSLVLETLEVDMLNGEVEKLKELFSKGYYYGQKEMPTDSELQKIAFGKISSYGNQGYQVSRYFPNAALLQNETPYVLRTQMLNIFNDEENEIPAIYPYGKSSNG